MTSAPKHGPKAKKTARRTTLQLVVSPQERAFIKMQAEKSGQTVSTWIHKKIFKEPHMRAEDFTEDMKDAFQEAFYDAADVDDRDGGANPRPWGCPWTYDEDGRDGWLPLAGETVEDAAVRWWKLNRGEIHGVVAEEA